MFGFPRRRRVAAPVPASAPEPVACCSLCDTELRVEQRIIWVDVSQAPYRQERVHWGCFLASPPPAAPMLPVARCTVCGEPEFCDCAPF
jgi:hypothetical protein